MSMKTQLHSALCLASVTLASTAASTACDDNPTGTADQEVTAPFEFAVEVTTQSRLRVDAVNGSINVTGSPAIDSIYVSGVRRVGAQTVEDAEAGLEQLNVAHTDGVDEITITTIQPQQPDGRNYVVEYEMVIPEGLEVIIENANGEIVVGAIISDVSVDNGNGSITLNDIEGSSDALIGNGTVMAEVTLPPGGTINMATANGSIDLFIPQTTSAELLIAVGNGTISVVNLELQNVVSAPRSLTGTLGAGDGTITLSTGNGDVTVTGG